MRAGWALLFLCACSGGTRLSQAREPWLRVQLDGGVELVLGGPDCPTLSPGAAVTLNGQPGTVLRRGGRTGACQGGCTEAVVRWPDAAEQLDFAVSDDGQTLGCTVDRAAPRLGFTLDTPDGGLAHFGFGAPLALAWEPKLPIERARIELKNPALPWRGGKPVVLCGPGACVRPGADAGAVLFEVPRTAMPGHTGLTATALFTPRVLRCQGAARCENALPAVPATASSALIIDP